MNPAFRITAVIGYLIAALALPGCSSEPKAPEIEHVMLPTREMQATFPAEFKKVHEAALRCVRDQLGYTVNASHMDVTKGRGRIDGSLSDGGTVRVETERAHDPESTQVQVFAVNAGSKTGNTEVADNILDRLRSALWPESK